MKKKLRCILLIDDDEPTNFLNELIIKKSGYTEKTVSVQSGKTALEFINSNQDGEYLNPDLIFLDLNMPSMNGWEFIEAFRKVDKKIQEGIIIVVLTTSINPSDRVKANSIREIDHFMIKPLTVATLQEVFDEYFQP